MNEHIGMYVYPHYCDTMFMKQNYRRLKRRGYSEYDVYQYFIRFGYVKEPDLMEKSVTPDNVLINANPCVDPGEMFVIRVF